MRKAAKSFVAALFFAVAFSTAEARADPIVITSGFVQIGGQPLSPNAFRATNFNFAGGNIAASGGHSDDRRQVTTGPCAFDPCGPGTVVSPGSAVTLTGVGMATVDGVSFGAWYFGGTSTLTFTGPGVVLPAFGPQTLTLTTPFTMAGNLVLHPLDALPTVQTVFSGLIEGQGVATLTFRFFEQPGILPDGYVLSSIRYDFGPAAVPEPATVLLLGTGLAGAAANYRRRRARKAAR